jgi:hypothetical protein
MDDKPTPSTGYLAIEGNHFLFITNLGRPKGTAEITAKNPSEWTDADKMTLIEAYNPMTASAGTVAIKGDQMFYSQEVTKVPHLKGRNEGRKAWFENGRLIQEFTAAGVVRNMVWARVPKK